MALQLKDIAKQINATLVGDENYVVMQFASIDSAGPEDIAFFKDKKYLESLRNTQAGAVILSEDLAHECDTNKLIVKDPYLGFALAAQLFEKKPLATSGIHPTAVIAESAEIASSASIGPGCVIGEKVVIADNTVVKANVVIESNTTIGKDCLIYPNVTIYHQSQIADQVIIHANSVIGSDGFGNAKDQRGNWVKIPQLGKVVIGSNVEIGACTTIDRGALGDTIIDGNVRIDNHVQIAHNVQIGQGTAMAAGVGVAGSTKIGKNCLLAGNVGVAGHLTIADNVAILAMSGVGKSLRKPGAYSASMPAIEAKKWWKIYTLLRNIERLKRRITDLEKQTSRENHE